jgi:GTP cyclohydrolase I
MFVFDTLPIQSTTMRDVLIDTRYRKIEEYDNATLDPMIEAYSKIIGYLGEDPNREGLIKTPERIAKMMQFLTHGSELNPTEILQEAIFAEDYSEMVLVKDIELYSLCEHHMLPFFGKAHIAYIPNGRIVGLSKIPRIVDAFSRRLQVQERLTLEIMNCVHDAIKPLGVAIIIEAQHMCMMMRGVQKQSSVTTTSAFTGEFQKVETRSEFLNLVGAKLS